MALRDTLAMLLERIEQNSFEIGVEMPAARLREGVAWVDTPGLGSLVTSGAAETAAYLLAANAARAFAAPLHTAFRAHAAPMMTQIEAWTIAPGSDNTVEMEADLHRLREFDATVDLS